MDQENGYIATKAIIDADPALDDLAVFLASVKHSYFVECFIKKKPRGEVQQAYGHKYKVQRRFLNAIDIEVKRLVDSALAYKAKNANRIGERLKEIQKEIKSLSKSLQKLRNKNETIRNSQRKKKQPLLSTQQLRTKLHTVQRKKQKLKDQHIRLQKALESEIPNICFGSKKKVRARHTIGNNRYKSLPEWQEDWNSRKNQIYLVGRACEKSGNELCHLIPSGDGYVLKVRLPEALWDRHSHTTKDRHGEYLLSPIVFQYHQDIIKNALENRYPITYRFIKKDGKQYVHVYCKPTPVKITTSKEIGVLALDLNRFHVDLRQLDPQGNPVKAPIHLKLDISYRKNNQVDAILSEVTKQIVTFAKENHLSLALEKLSFETSRAELKKLYPKLAKKLSSFPYARFYEFLRSQAQRQGVGILRPVNPAYTSIIGKANWANELGVSVHGGAAVAIGRRARGDSENPRPHNASLVPVRIRSDHVWSWWSKFHKRTIAMQEEALAFSCGLDSKSARGKAKPYVPGHLRGGLSPSKASGSSMSVEIQTLGPKADQVLREPGEQAQNPEQVRSSVSLAT